VGAKRRELAWLSACVLLALVLRLHGLRWGLPEVYEEATPFRQAWEMWGWGPQKPFDLNPHFFKYPSLTIYLQFLGQGILYLLLFVTDRVRSALDFRVLYELDKTPFYLAGRAITALLGTAIVLPVFASARMISREYVEAIQIASPSKVMPLPAFESVLRARSTFPSSYVTR